MHRTLIVSVSTVMAFLTCPEGQPRRGSLSSRVPEPSCWGSLRLDQGTKGQNQGYVCWWELADVRLEGLNKVSCDTCLIIVCELDWMESSGFHPCTHKEDCPSNGLWMDDGMQCDVRRCWFAGDTLYNLLLKDSDLSSGCEDRQMDIYVY